MTEAVKIDGESGYSEASILLVRLGGHLKQLLEVSDASTSNSYDVDVPGHYEHLPSNRSQESAGADGWRVQRNDNTAQSVGGRRLAA